MGVSKRRSIEERVTSLSGHKFGRIIVVTGARQVGKTTLVKKLFPGSRYFTLDDYTQISPLLALTAEQWHSILPNAVLDEVQKQPRLIDSVKAVYDQYKDCRYVLLGSSQILLLDKVRESLAGRCSIVEMYPLTLPELETSSGDDAVKPSLWQSILNGEKEDILPDFTLHSRMGDITKAWHHYSTFGGYPALVDETLTDEERYQWLRDYSKTYLERDVRDLSNIRDLEPYFTLQQITALRTAQTINATDIANQSGISTKTVQRYLQYLSLSYQIIRLGAWFKNPEKRLVKTEKIHFMDYGILQAVLHKTGGTTGAEFESLVISEIYRQTKTLGADVMFYHYRSHDGAEVDLLVETADGYYAFEIKQASKVSQTDARHLFKLGDVLDKPLIHGYVLSLDNRTIHFSDNITAISALYMLG